MMKRLLPLLASLLLICCVNAEHTTIKFCTFYYDDERNVILYYPVFNVYIPGGTKLTKRVLVKRFSEAPISEDDVVFGGVTYQALDDEFFVIKENDIGGRVIDIFLDEDGFMERRNRQRDVIWRFNTDELLDFGFETNNAYCVISKYKPVAE